jgi:hypothetical protein
MVALEHAGLLGRQFKLAGAAIKRIDAPEQAFIQQDLVPMLGA